MAVLRADCREPGRKQEAQVTIIIWARDDGVSDQHGRERERLDSNLRCLRNLQTDTLSRWLDMYSKYEVRGRNSG